MSLFTHINISNPNSSFEHDEISSPNRLASLKALRALLWPPTWTNRRSAGPRRAVPASQQPGWRSTVVGWTCVVLVVLLVNVTILIWSCVHEPPELPLLAPDSGPRGNSKILYMGDCDTVSRYKLWIHFGINVMSSLLLMASMNCMQCLGSPTRQELDRLHANGNYLDISILSSRNFKYISRLRLFLWVLLALSSLPLHLFNNSVIFTSLGARNISTFVTSQDFVKDQSLNATTMADLSMEVYSGFQSPPDMQTTMQQSARFLMPFGSDYRGKSLSTADCLDQFSGPVVSTWKAVAIVLNVTNPQQVLTWAGLPGNGLEQPWTCIQNPHDHDYHPINASDLFMSCGGCQIPPEGLIDGFVSRRLCGADGDPSKTFTAFAQSKLDVVVEHLAGRGLGISSCEAMPAQGYCGLESSPSLFAYVVAANIVKAAAMLFTVFYLKFEPIVTVGDAVRTFLNENDPATKGAGPLSSKIVSTKEIDASKLRDSKDSHWNDVLAVFDEECQPLLEKPWNGYRRRWAQSVSTLRWILVLGLCTILATGAVIILYVAVDNGALSKSRETGFGAVSSRYFNPLGIDDMAALSLVANTPQILVSIVHVAHNSMLSAMVGSAEMTAFASQRKTLRVSAPQKGAQKGTYWLSIPLQYSLPLMLAMIVLHYLISQAIFIVRLNQVDSGPLTPNGDDRIVWGVMDGIGYSPVAVLASIPLGIMFFFLAPILLGLRKLPPGMPIVGNNSIAIAAACHVDTDEPADAAERPLMYGVLPALGPTKRRRVGFSSMSVEPLIDGEVYECMVCVHKIRNPNIEHFCRSEDTEMAEIVQSDRVIKTEGESPVNFLEEERGNLRDSGDDMEQDKDLETGRRAEEKSLLKHARSPRRVTSLDP